MKLAIGLTAVLVLVYVGGILAAGGFDFRYWNEGVRTAMTLTLLMAWGGVLAFYLDGGFEPKRGRK